jgi:hypothetical protein
MTNVSHEKYIFIASLISFWQGKNYIYIVSIHIVLCLGHSKRLSSLRFFFNDDKIVNYLLCSEYTCAMS